MYSFLRLIQAGAFALIVGAVAGCGKPADTVPKAAADAVKVAPAADAVKAAEAAKVKEAVEIATDAYVYGYSLVKTDVTRVRRSTSASCVVS